MKRSKERLRLRLLLRNKSADLLRATALRESSSLALFLVMFVSSLTEVFGGSSLKRHAQ